MTREYLLGEAAFSSYKALFIRYAYFSLNLESLLLIVKLLELHMP